MRLLPHDQYQRTLFALLLAFFSLSCINPPYLQFLLLQHIPTILVMALLVYISNHFEISRASFTAIIIFLGLHVLGARYLYSYVPYDDWAEKLFGMNITETFGFDRNHYDRFVHFSYGLLVVIPIQEFERRYLRLSARLAGLLAIECILATSAAYEICEWLVAVVFAPDWADSFLGQQGDPFDAQKDMALATGGSILSILLSTVLHHFQMKSSKNDC